MEQSLTALFSLQFICLCLAVAGINTVLRKITEVILDNPKVPASKTSKLWKELFLPISPLVTGVLLTLFLKGLPYPEGWAEHRDSRMMLGFIAGLLSGLVYRVVNSFLKDKLETLKASAAAALGKPSANARPGNVMPPDDEADKDETPPQ